MKSILVVLFLLLLQPTFGQVLSGRIDFRGDCNYDEIIIYLGRSFSICDTAGNFSIKSYNGMKYMDTLKIQPYSGCVTVKVFNIPKNGDTVYIAPIPLFAEVDTLIPLINFKTKRASRKYFKKREKEQQEDELELVQLVSEYVYNWNERNYKLKLVKSSAGYIVLLDLKQN